MLHETLRSNPQFNSSVSSSQGTQPSVQNFTRQIKLDLPRFDGTESLSWLFWAEHYFSFYQIPDHQRIMVASVHFDGSVVPWF